jgi:hypothetical protein
MPRKPEYLSPTSRKLFKEDPVEYYRRYLSETRPPKFQQTQPMAAGSAFDAMVKSYLHDTLFGKGHKDSAKYDKRAIFEAEVESQNRDWAWPVGEHIFQSYLDSGALADLMIELQGAADEPRFEFDLKGEVRGSREPVSGNVNGVVLMGKPDLRFINGEGAHVIYDWKVNGYCSNSNTSPKQGYTMLRDRSSGFWQRMGAHKNSFPQLYKGMWINAGCYLESVEPDWACQLATYGWLLGEPVGSEIITGIDQIACNGAKQDLMGRPELRVSSIRMRVSEQFQYQMFESYVQLWSILQDIGTERFYFFRDLSFEESKMKCESLEREVQALQDPETPSDVRWAIESARG